MRIALVTPHAAPMGPDAVPGRRPRVIALAQALAHLGHEVSVYARQDAVSLPPTLTVEPGVRIEHIPAGPKRRLATDELAPYVRQFGDHLGARWREDPPEIVHAYSWPSGLAALAGTRGMDVPVVQTFGSVGAPAGRYRIRQPCEPLARLRLKASIARNVHAMLARSSQEMRELTALGVPRSSVHVVPWGVDTAHFCPDGPAVPRGGEVHRLLACWPMTGQHGLGLVIRALRDVPGTELVIAGGPPSRQLAKSKLHRELNQLAGKVGVAGRVTFSGAVSWEELPALLRSGDLMVSAAWEGLFDPAALQAMACGTPVVAPPAGFYADAVIDETTGLLVPPARPALLARRIRRLLASPLQLEAFGIAAADRARSRYSWDRIGREIVHVYQRCLPQPVTAGAPAEDAEEAEPVEGLALAAR
jgi:D-inositol-3-phosphate glycosyltransferase